MENLGSVLVVGTRRHLGVGGSMADGLRARGIDAQLFETRLDYGSHFVERCASRMAMWLPGPSPRVRQLNVSLTQAVLGGRSRIAIVTNGREFCGSTVREIRAELESRGGGIACYLCDDPFNPAHRTQSWLDALPHYSLVVSTKRAIIGDLRSIGCTRVEYARFGYNPEFHRAIRPAVRGFSASDLAFAGNADRDRLPILGALVDRLPDLSIHLFGDGWAAHRSLKRICRPQVVGLDYSAAMLAATVCPCLVRRANRDGHVMRSFELPAIGAFMLAERTAEHMEIFEEQVHCDFWSSIDELVEKSRWYAKNPNVAARIARRGHELVRSGRHTYGDRAEEVIRLLVPCLDPA